MDEEDVTVMSKEVELEIIREVGTENTKEVVAENSEETKREVKEENIVDKILTGSGAAGPD